ncbi:FAD-binding protein [Salipiger sp. HF18]|nr:FAD-binding protein [Salipiger sp. HF18]
MPRSADEAARILRACNAARVGVVPFGGGTGLVGGQVAPDTPAPLIVSLERMSAIRAVYPQENVLVAEAGAVLASVQEAAREAGATVFAYGAFLTAVINFFIIAFVVFMLVKTVNRVKSAAEKPDEVAPEVKTGPSELDILIEIRDSLKR